MLEVRDSVIVTSDRFIVRRAAVDDIKEMSGVLERAGLSSFRREILEFNLASSSTRMFVGCRDGQVVGVAGCARFGSTGWLGDVAVDGHCCGQGFGRAISKTAVDCLHQAGVETVLLTATERGKPMYEGIGFADEGVSSGIWEQRQAPILGCDRSATVQPGQVDEAIRQDADTTGEDRRSYLAPFADRVRVVAGRSQAGYWAALPWGGGPVIAASRAAARPSIVDMIRASPGSRLAFPELNVHGAAVAVSLGFHLARRVRRMRLGPPVPGFRPGVIYNAFSLAAG